MLAIFNVSLRSNPIHLFLKANMPRLIQRYKLPILVCVCWLISIAQGITQEHPIAKNAVIDLRGVDLSKETVTLNGEWAMCWQKLCKPGDPMTDITAIVPFPKRWDQTTIDGEALPSQGYASYMLTVLMPKQHGKLALEVPDTYTSYRLFLNGELFVSAGNPDTTKERAEAKWIQFTQEIANPTDTIHLILQVANFWHSKGGPYKAISIGDRDKLFYKRYKNAAFDMLLTGCLFMCGLFFFGLYLFGRYDKVILFFALFCITYSYRIIGSGTYVLHSMFPNLPWEITVHLEYLSLFISVVFFTQYTRYLYPEDSSKTIINGETWACLALSAITLVFPPSIFTRLINPFLLVMFTVIAYAFFIYVKAVRNNRLGAKYALMSTGIVLLVFIIINLQYFGIVAPQKEILFTGYILFFFLQSLILSFRFSYQLNKARTEAEQGLIAKSDFLSNMSHEIRTPLNSVIGLSNILLENKPREDQREQLNVLLFSANNLLTIVNDILDYNKIEAGKINFEYIDMDLGKVIQDIVTGSSTLAKEKGIDLRLEKDPAFTSRIIGDPTRISQVVGNLVQNAIKFTRTGHVIVRIKQEKFSRHHVTLTISVEDTGIGIAPDKQKLIFERFTQADSSTSRSFGGTGLGLAICKKILNLQGSRLQLKSEQGKGSVFYFTQTFPVSLSTTITEIAEQPDVAAGMPLIGVRILLAEDNELNVLVARTFLEKWGATIDVAVNGQQAVEMLNPEKHHIILMDMHMPVMDGYQAISAIREKGIALPIVAITASLPAEVEERAQASGLKIDATVTKPFEPAAFLKIILRLLKQP